ncbi:MAG: hypothetical protein J6P61_01395 [Erysipelotrichaceae bacterium]|nr:hypothetical protein [Erysipelotrichaceae bacterium]
MNDFINFGNADLLEQYYEKRLIEPSVSRVVHAMNLIAKGTQFCDMVTYKNGLEEMKSALADIKEKEHDDFLTIFIEYIEKSFKSSFDEILKSPIPIIERCIEKKLYQQALTFIESTMPEYIVDLKILYATKDTERNISKCKNRYESDKQFIVNQYINQHLMYFSKEPKRDLKKAINEFSYYYLNRFEKSDDNSNISCMKSLDFKKNNQIKKIVREKKTVKEFVIKIRSDYLNKYSKMDQQVGMFLRMHKALKSVRNMFNHTIADERPDMDAIINTMKLYVAYAKRIENLVRKSDGTIY